MKKQLIYTAMLLTLLVFVFGKPSENDFLDEIQHEYGQIHQGMELSKADLVAMGESRYQSFLLWSHYCYAFGSIEVAYIGFAFMVFPLQSKAANSNLSEPSMAYYSHE